MKYRFAVSAWGLLLGYLAGGAVAPVQADVVRLHSGAELRGKVISPKGTLPKEGVPGSSLVLKTLVGAEIEIDAALVAFVARRPLSHEEYEVKARRTPSTVEAQWELAQWCRERHLPEQQEIHNRQVILLEPDHEEARRALGHVWKEGAWVDLDDYMAERGYVKHRGRWITQQEHEVLEKTAAELAREQEWYGKIRLWTNWVTSSRGERIEKGMAALKEVQDSDAAPAIWRVMGRHASRPVRQMAVAMLERSAGSKSAVALAQMVLAEMDVEIRFAAIQAIPASQFSVAQSVFLSRLRSSDNGEVNRAAIGLRHTGNEEAIQPLIMALITSHRYQVKVPGGTGTTYSFGTNGSFGQQAALPPGIEVGLRTGQYPNGVILLNSPDPTQNLQSKWVTVQYEHRNVEVLATLQKATGADFGYDERTWLLWWAAQKHSGGLPGETALPKS